MVNVSPRALASSSENVWNTDLVQTTDIQSPAGEQQPLIAPQPRRSWFSRFGATAAKVGAFVVNASVFAVTTAFGIKTLLGSANVVDLSLCALFNGATFSVNGHLAFSPENRRKINQVISSLSYETLLALFLIYLNLAPADKAKLYATPFVWMLGVLLSKDILTLGSKKETDLPPFVPTPQEEELLRTIGFTTRNKSCACKSMVTAQAVIASSATVLNFVFIDQYQNLDPLGQRGFIQDLIAGFSGSVVGEAAARVLDDLREALESQHSLQEGTPPPFSLKLLRFAKNYATLTSTVAIAVLLAVPAPPNSLQDYALKFSIGGLYGSHMLLARREFENPNSYLHALTNGINSIKTHAKSCKEKVAALAKKYLFSATYFAGLTAFMAYAATQDTQRDQIAIGVLLVTTIASFAFTDALAVKYTPQRNHRITNELSFRLLYSALALSVLFQYLTTKLNVDDRSLNRDTNFLYGLALVTWFSWGIVVGNTRALNIQPRNRYALEITPPIATQELTKTFVGNIKSLFTSLNPKRV